MNKRELIKNIVCTYFGISFCDMIQKSRRADIRYPRQVLCYLWMGNTKMGCKAVSKVFGQDHTTVLHSVKAIEDLLFADEVVQNDIRHLQQLIRKQPVSIYAVPGVFSNTGHLNLVNKLSDGS